LGSKRAVAQREKLVEALSGVFFFVLAGAVARAAEPEPEKAAVVSTERSATPSSEPAAEKPARVASYTLSARLDEKEHRVTASGTITWRNTARISVSELYLHLYMNAFKNQRSLFLRSPFEEARSGARAEEWGYVDVERLVARELGADLWPGRASGSPADPDDETDVRLPLPRAVEPGERLTLDIAFSVKLPVIVERTGHSRDFHLVAQWFPKLARLESDGTWAHFSFHPQAEFYADFGDYDVTLDVPAAAVVGATGRLVESRRSGARRTERYQAGPVHDFAWVAWPDFRERKARVGPVDVRVLYPPDGDKSATIELETATRGLERFSRLYGEYPYPTLTIVHPPDEAAAAGGMEYPTFITTGGPWYRAWLGPRAIESVTLHELLHQWFYGIVATDEAKFPFLDEGVTSYAELSALDAFHGSGSAYRGFGLELSAASIARVFAALRSEDVPVAGPAASFPGFRSLAALVYSRTATTLETLARVYGREKLERAIGRYAREQRFEHPRPDALMKAIRAELGEEAAKALEVALMRRGRVDYLVREIQTTRDRPPGGVFDRQGKRSTVTPGGAKPGRWHGRVVVYRHGDIELPIEIELVDEDGNRKRERWDGQGTHRVIDWQGSAPLAYARLDPDERVLLDDNLMNNGVAREATPPTRTFERAFYLSELALAWLAP
jgi:hypothetical protein